MTAAETEDAKLQEYLANIAQPTRKRDAHTLVELMRRATGEQPRVWGSMVGFGQYHYKYASGREGDAAPVGFAARKAATTVYMLDGVGAHAELLERLGPHKTGVGCLYLKDLAAVDLSVLEQMIKSRTRPSPPAPTVCGHERAAPSTTDHFCHTPHPLFTREDSCNRTGVRVESEYDQRGSG